MCCIMPRVKRVQDTRIFARSLGKGRQAVVYSMALDTDEDPAMILPLPVRDKTGEDDVKFINLEKYPDFFKDLQSGFPEPRALKSKSLGGGFGGSKPTLKVHEVGGFEASFAPTVTDLDRLDPRFRLPTEFWNQIPEYKRYGFAVFKLKKGNRKIHPMAFSFPSAKPRRLFFPTVHVHDGKIHKTATFDHALYCQFSDERAEGLFRLPSGRFRWEESPQHSQQFVDIDRCQGLIESDAHCYRRRMVGRFKNVDVWA